MTKAEAGQIVTYLNAAFHREALEPATVAFWVGEIERLKSFEDGLATAKQYARTSDRFPTLHQFREDYLSRRGREVDRVKQIESVTSGPRKLPDVAVDWLARHGLKPELRDVPD